MTWDEAKETQIRCILKVFNCKDNDLFRCVPCRASTALGAFVDEVLARLNHLSLALVYIFGEQLEPFEMFSSNFFIMIYRRWFSNERLLLGIKNLKYMEKQNQQPIWWTNWEIQLYIQASIYQRTKNFPYKKHYISWILQHVILCAALTSTCNNWEKTFPC